MPSPKTSSFTFQQFLRNSRTRFVLDDHNLVAGQIRLLLSTRDHGGVVEGTPGRHDVLEGRRLKKEILSAFQGAHVELDHVDEWVQLEVTLPSGVKVAQVAPLPAAPSAEGRFYKAPQFKEVREFADTGAISNIPQVAEDAVLEDNLDLSVGEAVSDAEDAPPTPVEIAQQAGGESVSTLNRLVVDSVDPKAEKAIPGNEAKMPKTALEVNNLRMQSWLRQVYSR